MFNDSFSDVPISDYSWNIQNFNNENSTCVQILSVIILVELGQQFVCSDKIWKNLQ